MFISLELSSRQPLFLNIQILNQLKNLHSTIMEAMEHYKDTLKALFPSDAENRSFMLTFECVIDDAKDQAQTYQLTQQEFYTDPNTDHLPHCNIESFYWAFLWAFVCAIPVDSADKMNW